jgi:sphinganine C4-monooxygenase
MLPDPIAAELKSVTMLQMASTNRTTITSQASAPLLPWISDEHLSLFVFPIFFWAFSFFFMVIEWAGILQEYRLRTPTEEVTLNRVNRRDCLINVFFNQVIQVLAGLAVQLVDDSNNGTTTWNMMAQPLVSCLLSGLNFAGIDIIRLAEKYPGSVQGLEEALVAVVQSYLVPAFQFLVALFVADTWQYFSHRWCHTNKYVYSTWIEIAHLGPANVV